MSPIEALEAFLKALNGAHPGTTIGIMLSLNAFCWVLRQESGRSYYVTYDLGNGLGFVEVGHNDPPVLTFELKHGAHGWGATFNPSDQNRWAAYSFKYNFASLQVTS